MPFFHTDKQRPGSTDVGDVSWQTPAAQINTVTWPALTPGHSWQAVSAGKSSIAHKGLLYAAQVLAAAAVDLLTGPELLAAAKAEFAAVAQKGYTCPLSRTPCRCLWPRCSKPRAAAGGESPVKEAAGQGRRPLKILTKYRYPEVFRIPVFLFRARHW